MEHGKKASTNCFHEYMKLLCRKRGMTLVELRERLFNEDMVVARQWTWETSKRPPLQLGKRVDLIEKVATILGEPMSRLAFLSGMNPWARRIPLNEQNAIWEFVERIVKAREEKHPKPSDVTYRHLCNQLFGGAEIITTVPADALAEYMKPEDEAQQ